MEVVLPVTADRRDRIVPSGAARPPCQWRHYDRGRASSLRTPQGPTSRLPDPRLRLRRRGLQHRLPDDRACSCWSSTPTWWASRPRTAGSIFLFVKFWDAFADIFAGRMVDRTMTRWGKFRPFLLVVLDPAAGREHAVLLDPGRPATAPSSSGATVTYALLGLLYSLVNIPYGSLAGAMSQNPVDRSRLAVGAHGRIRGNDPAARPRPRAADQGLATTSRRTFLITASSSSSSARRCS